MRTPIGLQKPHRIAELIPPVLALLGVATATFFAILHLTQMGWPSLT